MFNSTQTIIYTVCNCFLSTKYSCNIDSIAYLKSSTISSTWWHAFWKKPKGSLKDKDYNQFYQSIAVDYEDPIFHIHTQAEGTIDYTTLFYVPKNAPFDLFNPDFQPGVKLYVKRVFITDNDKELMPTYLRFIRGVIDSEDLPLNVSREILQKNRVLAKIKNNSVKKILSELLKYSEDKKKYTDFIDKFGIPIKEGLYQDHDNRDEETDQSPAGHRQSDSRLPQRPPLGPRFRQHPPGDDSRRRGGLRQSEHRAGHRR